MPAPANDNFADAVVLSGTGGTEAIDNVGATYETGEPANFGGADGLASVWYTLTTGANGGLGWLLHLSTDATPEMWDSTLELFTGTDLSDLVIVAFDDDIDYPTDIRSEIDATLADSTTYWIRVDQWGPYTGWSGAETSDGVLTWSLAAVVPAPTITSWARSSTISTQPRGSATEVWSGEEITLDGTNLDALTSVTVGGGAVPWDVTSSTEIVLHVNTTARTGPIEVVNTGGSASTAGVLSDVTVRFPGPWVTVGTAEAVMDSYRDGDYSADEISHSGTIGDTSQPAWAGSLAYTPPPSVYARNLASQVELTAKQTYTSDALPDERYEFTWRLILEVLLLDATPTADNMPPVTPASGGWPAHVVDVDVESDVGEAVSDPTVLFAREVTLGDYVDDIDKDTLTYPDDVDDWDQTVQWRRVTAPPSVLPDAAALAALPLDADLPAWISGVASAGTFNHAGTGGTTNYEAGFDGPNTGDPTYYYADPGVVPWTDWSDTKLMWLPVPSRISSDPAVVIPQLGPPPVLEAGLKDLIVNNRARATWTYQPPRYRFIYDLPPVTTPTTLRRRQQAASVGSAPRRRQIANRAGSLRRGPGAAT